MNKLVNLFYNRNEHRMPAGWRIIAGFVIYLILNKAYIFLINSMGIMLYYSSDSPLSTFFIGGTVRLLPPFLALWIAGKFIDKRKITDFGFLINKNWWIDFGFGFALGTVLMTAIFVCEYLFGYVTISEVMHSTNEQYNFLVPLLIFLFVFIGTGIGEELFSRGYLIKNISEGFNSKSISPKAAILIALVLSSIGFGLGHLGNPNATFISTFNIAMIGVFLGIGFIYNGQLAIPIGIHISWNFFQANVFGFPVSGQTYPAGIVSIFKIEQGGPDLITGGAFGPEAGLLGLAAMLVGIAFTYLYLKNRININPNNIYTPIAQAPQK